MWFSRARLRFGRGRNRKINVYMVATQYLLEDAFLRSQNLPVDLPFDFVEYTTKCTTHMFVKMINLGWRLWSIFLTWILAIAIFSGLYHKLNGNTFETTDIIITHDPDNNVTFYNAFTISGWILICYNFLCLAFSDSTFEGLIRLEMKRLRAKEEEVREHEEARTEIRCFQRHEHPSSFLVVGVCLSEPEQGRSQRIE